MHLINILAALPSLLVFAAAKSSRPNGGFEGNWSLKSLRLLHRVPIKVIYHLEPSVHIRLEFAASRRSFGPDWRR